MSLMLHLTDFLPRTPHFTAYTSSWWVIFAVSSHRTHLYDCISLALSLAIIVICLVSLINKSLK
jgi:hypothetical protein